MPDLAGLLACPSPKHPSHSFEQWIVWFGSGPLLAWTYSYGDSAGFTPVFPFNLSIESAEPNPEQM
jgi:hypothetical protein